MKASRTGTTAEATLQKLADALGCPVSDFVDPLPDDRDQTRELLRLWAGIEAVGDRTKVLAFIEGLTAEAGPGRSARPLVAARYAPGDFPPDREQ